MYVNIRRNMKENLNLFTIIILDIERKETKMCPSSAAGIAFCAPALNGIRFFYAHDNKQSNVAPVVHIFLPLSLLQPLNREILHYALSYLLGLANMIQLLYYVVRIPVPSIKSGFMTR